VLAVVPPVGVALALNVLAASPPAGASAPQPEDAAARYRKCGPGRRFLCCSPQSQPCIRSGAARLTLLSLGVAAGAVASGLLFAFGDRYAGGDPATLFVGAGMLAGAGALFGSLVGRLGGDRPGNPDRVRPSTVGLDYRVGTPANLDETEPHAMLLTFAPNWFFPRSGGRARLFGHFGGQLWAEREVDPRPQNDVALADQRGTAPVVLRERQLSAGVGIDLAVATPYPATKRSAFLGPAELRWKPEVQIRREVIGPGSATEHVVERTMLLPLTAGVRWILSARQRFTFYFGPRFDLVAFSEPGSQRVHRGRPHVAAMYGEAWYDVDFPMTLHPRRDGKPRRAMVNSQLNLGYVHSRFDGNGFNFGPVIGFLGPLHVRWTTRVRPNGWRVALQPGAGVAIGSNFAAVVSFGVAVPDLGEKR
jgi:hypothetical protein